MTAVNSGEAVPVTLCPLRGDSRIGHLRTEVVLGTKRHPVGISSR